MGKKTVVRRMLALAPLKALSPLDTALRQEDAVEGSDGVVRAQDWQGSGPVIDAEVVDEPPHDPETGEIKETASEDRGNGQRPLGF